MPNGAEGGPPVDRETRLLAQFPTRRGPRTLAPLDPTTGKLPKAGEKARGGPALNEPAPLTVHHDHDRGSDMGAADAHEVGGKDAGVVELTVGATGEADRAREAVRVHRAADDLAELHDRLVEGARVRDGQELLERPRESGRDGRVPYVPLLPCPPRRNPLAVRLQCHARPVERDRRDRARDVRTDAGQRLELGYRGREPAVAVADDRSRGGVEVVRSGVVARPLPHLQDPVGGRARERDDARELANELLEVRRGLRDPGLLEEDLRDPHAVRVPVRAPRKRAAVGAVPPE